MNMGNSDERPKGSSIRKDQARTTGVQAAESNADFTYSTTCGPIAAEKASIIGWINPRLSLSAA